GLLSPVSLELSGGESWSELQIDLSPLAGRGSVGLTLRASGAPALLMLGGVRRMGPSDASRPNTVLWIVDTLRSDRLSSYGYGLKTDPVLAQLAAEGVRVEHVYAASNWTRPSVSSLLTGVGPEIHGNDAPGRQIDEELVTLAGELSRAGYLTVSFNTNYHAGLWSGLDKGFDVQFQPRHFPRLDPPTSLTSTQIAGPLAQFVEQHAGEALFLYVHCLDPHAPYAPHQQDVDALAAQGTAGAPVPTAQAADARLSFRERSPAYDAEILNADRELGRFDAQLDRLGLAADTLFVFTSDHGESFAEHGTWGHWRSLYESEVRVPWVMRWPDGLPAGRVVDTWAGHIDLAPTMLGLLSLPRPIGWTGRDLSAVMRGSSSHVPEVVQVIDTISGEKETLGQRSLAAVGNGWKLIVDLGDDGELRPRRLFEVAADPGEVHDWLPERGAPEVLLEALADHLRRAEALGHGQGAADAALDPELQRWLEEMGYLR
ncbi:MAG: choline-sulfatase, partial [Pseudohongiellaceae bacterium]